MQEVLDLTGVGRRRKRSCRHTWLPWKGGRDRCTECKDVFPCRGACEHVDCILRRVELGEDEIVPEDFPVSITVTETRGELEVILLDTTPDDYADWTQPVTPA